MFGTFRLILAVMVAISHLDIKAYGRHPGVVAIVCFFIISGFVMTGVIRSYYQDNKTMFYLDRFMRIYPQYLFFLGLTIIMFWISGAWSIVSPPGNNFLYNLAGGGEDIYKNYINYLKNFTIVPLNFPPVTGNGTLFILPAWSLGLEIQFYAILPFILRLKALKPYLVLYSILIFSFASYNLINEQTFGYFLLPGTLFIFLSGSLLYDYVHGDKAIWKYICGLYLYILIFFVTVIMSRDTISTMTNISVIDVCTGYLLGLPLIFLLSLLKRRKFDEFLGNISYGVFLSHFLIIWFFPHYGIFDPKNNIFLFLLCSILLGLTGYYLVERPVVQWRRRIRKNAIK